MKKQIIALNLIGTMLLGSVSVIAEEQQQTAERTPEAISEEIQDLFKTTTDELNDSLEETIETVGITYESYVANKQAIYDWYKLLKVKTVELFEATDELVDEYIRLIATEAYSAEADDLLDDLYDDIYEDAYEDIYDGIYEDAFDELYDTYYDGCMDDWSETVAWALKYEQSHEFYNLYYFAKNAFYDRYYNYRGDLYDKINLFNSAFYDENYDAENVFQIYEDLR